MKRALAATWIVAFCVIVIAPIVHTVSQAFIGREGVIRGLIDACINARVLGLMANSLLISCGTSMFALAIGVPMGFLIGRTDVYMRKVLRCLYLLPLAIPTYVAGIAWIHFLKSSGPINMFFVKWLGMGTSVVTIYGVTGVIWVLGLSYFPFITLLTISGLATLDREYEEQARLFVGRGKTLKKITLPMILPFVAAGTLFVFVFAVSNYGVPSLLRVNTYPVEIFALYSAFYDHGLAGLSSIPLLLVTGGLICVSCWIMRGRDYISWEGASRRIRVSALGIYRLPCSLFVWMIVLISGMLPMIVLVVSSGSFQAYLVALKTSVRPIITSIACSALGAAACVILGYGLAYIIERGQWRGRRILDVATVLPLAVPPVVLGIGLIELWNTPAAAFIYSGLPMMVFGFVARFVPFAVKIMGSCFKHLHSNMEEAAALAGVGFLKATRRVLLPLMKPGILASFAICFVFCMGEIATTLLVMPPGAETLASKIYTVMHYGVGNLTAALCVILILVSIVPACVLSLAFERDMSDD